NLDHTITFLKEQISATRQLLADSEQRLHRFRSDEGLMGQAALNSSGRESGLVDQFGQLQQAFLDEQMEHQLLVAKYDAVRQLLRKQSERWGGKNTTQALTGGVSSQIEKLQQIILNLEIEIDAKSETLHDESPEIVDLNRQLRVARTRLDQELRTLMQKGGELDPLTEWRDLVRQEADLAVQTQEQEQRVAVLRARMENFQREHPNLFAKETQFVQYQRQARQYEDTLDFLTRRISDVKMLREMQTTEFSVVSPATPPKAPSHPKVALSLVLAIMMGLTLGCGIAFFLDSIDDTVKGKQDVEKLLSLPLIAEVPHFPKLIPGRTTRFFRALRRKKVDDEAQVCTPEKFPPVQAEPYYRLRSTIRFIAPNARTIVVTSSVPQEGKTLTACRLAVSCARMGQKVLLADCDLRRPSVHTRFGISRDPGFTNYLHHTIRSRHTKDGTPAQEIAPSTVIRHTTISNLSILTAGDPLRDNAPVVQYTEMLSHFLTKWSQEYDVVIIDSPPVLTATDTQEIVSRSDAVFLVVRAGYTKLPLAYRTSEMLQRTGSQLIGFVLNDVNFRKTDDVYYSYYDEYAQKKKRR
ncbi:MAG: polysaccharide biosynthesis tyrosine autokinase, partial [Candidatus Poribacteria bacterium]|nr:polysaccharide biosynthesis tyrosine autokinase [Candidatus Poribacteria bacterium]